MSKRIIVSESGFKRIQQLMKEELEQKKNTEKVDKK